MQYRYRWHLAGTVFTLMLLAGYFYDLKDVRAEYQELVEVLDALHHRLDVVKGRDAKGSDVVKLDDLPVSLFECLNQSEVDLLSVTRSAGDYNLLLQSQQENIYKLLAAMSEKSDKLSIKHYVMQMKNKNQLQLSLRVAAASSLGVYVKIIDTLINPFCASSNLGVSTNVVHSRLYSVDQMRVVGDVVQGGKTFALVSWPNGDVEKVAVEPGANRELAVIQSIRKHKRMTMI